MSIIKDFDAVWGGYYAKQSPQTGHFSIFRLLDFDQYAYQAALFSERFESLPSESLVRGLTPFIGHVPIDACALATEGAVVLVARAPLSRDDLEGYLYYLEAHDVSEQQRAQLVESLIRSSYEPALPLRLEIVGETLSVTER